MAKRVFQAANWTAGAFADTSAITNANYMALRGGSATQLINVLAITLSGFAGASAASIMQLGRSSTVATTPTALASPNQDGPMHPATAALALPPVPFVAAAAGPQRSAAITDAKLNLGFNLFGGIFNWQAGVDSIWTILGNTASFGESVLSNFTGGASGSVSGHIVYEPL